MYKYGVEFDIKIFIRYNKNMWRSMKYVEMRLGDNYIVKKCDLFQ